MKISDIKPEVFAMAERAQATCEKQFKLIDEVAARFYLRIRIAGIVPRRNPRHQGQAQRVCAVFFDNFQRIDSVTERFTHLSALLVTDNTVNQHVAERYFTRMLNPRENHSRNPEEDNIVARDKYVRGIEILQIFRVIRITERRERPKRG